MIAPATADPGLTVALAAAAGVVVHLVARHLNVPAIVLLLGTGVLLGPDVAGIIDPGTLGHATHVVVGFAVAVILFEGGMNLNLRRLREEAKVIQRLITVGALVTAIGGALTARLAMGWGWRESILFGTLVIVTGPTVITPLLRRICLKKNLSTVLEAEGVLIDAVGALVAVVALEVALSPSGESLGRGVASLALRLGVGLAIGFAGGWAIARLLRAGNAVPQGMENVFTLALALALFQISNAVMPESGIMAAIVAGIVVGNGRTPTHRELFEFKEQLTLLLLGMIFILLAADTRVEIVLSLGWPGLVTVLLLMVVVRPLAVAASTYGTALTTRERVFMSWLAPRGIVAAAVASLFAERMELAGASGGIHLRALVFLVIAMTVVVQGLTGGWLARMLGLRRPSHNGYVILGANALARRLGQTLRDAGQDVVLIDANADACRRAEDEGFRIFYGSGLEERTLQRAEPETREACVALTPNEAVNLLFAQLARKLRVRHVFTAVHSRRTGVNATQVDELGGEILFGTALDLDRWTARAEKGTATTESWRLSEVREALGSDQELVLPMVLRRGGRVSLVGSEQTFRAKDEVVFAINEERVDEARTRLRDRGWTPAAGN